MIQVRRASLARGRPEIAMAPLIDMMFILLIFFVVTATFEQPTGVEVARPTASTTAPVDGGALRVAVTAAGGVHVEGRAITLGVLRGVVERELVGNRDRPVLIAADQNARCGLVVDVMDECRLAGAARVALAADRK